MPLAAKHSHWIAVVAVGGAGVIIGVWMTHHGFPVPRGDDSFYKSPAAELAQNGRLAIPCARGMFPRADVVFGCYPPLYQFALACWYLIFGFSLTSTLAFCHTVHLINSACVCAVAHGMLKRHTRGSTIGMIWVAAAAGLIQLGNIAYYDRPEETAFVWLWLELLVVQSVLVRCTILQRIASGACIGLAALTAPWVGLLGMLVVVAHVSISSIQSAVSVRSIRVWREVAGQVFGVCIVVGLVVSSWLAWLHWMHPGIIREQFLMVLQYHRELVPSGLAERFAVLGRTMGYNSSQLPAMVLTLFLFPAWVLRTGWRKVDGCAVSVYVAALVGLIAVVTLRPHAYTYWGACQLLLLPCLSLAIWPFVQPSRRRARAFVGYAALVVCVVAAGRSIAGYVWLNTQLPAAERPRAVFSQLRQWVPADANVGVSYRHWYAFQSRNDWRDVDWCTFTDDAELLKNEWLVLYPGKTPPALLDAFELVAEVRSAMPKHGTYSYTLWRRREQNRMQTD